MVQTLMRQPNRRADTKALRRTGWKRVVTGGGRIGPNGTRKVVRKGLVRAAEGRGAETASGPKNRPGGWIRPEKRRITCVAGCKTR